MRIDKKETLTTVFVSALVLSNILSAKLVAIGWMVVPGGILCYAITYLISDVIGELYGKAQANKTIVYGLIGQTICSILLTITLLLPAANEAVGAAYNTALKSSLWFTVASIISYITSQAIDIRLFHGIRSKLKENKRYKWVWNNVSTIASQAVDTIVYVVIAFGIGLSYFESGAALLWQMILSQFIVKVVLAIADTPFFYLLTRRGEK